MKYKYFLMSNAFENNVNYILDSNGNNKMLLSLLTNTYNLKHSYDFIKDTGNKFNLNILKEQAKPLYELILKVSLEGINYCEYIESIIKMVFGIQFNFKSFNKFNDTLKEFLNIIKKRDYFYYFDENIGFHWRMYKPEFGYEFGAKDFYIFDYGKFGFSAFRGLITLIRKKISKNDRRKYLLKSVELYYLKFEIDLQLDPYPYEGPSFNRFNAYIFLILTEYFENSKNKNNYLLEKTIIHINDFYINKYKISTVGFYLLHESHLSKLLNVYFQSRLLLYFDYDLLDEKFLLENIYKISFSYAYLLCKSNDSYHNFMGMSEIINEIYFEPSNYPINIDEQIQIDIDNKIYYDDLIELGLSEDLIKEYFKKFDEALDFKIEIINFKYNMFEDEFHIYFKEYFSRVIQYYLELYSIFKKIVISIDMLFKTKYQFEKQYDDYIGGPYIMSILSVINNVEKDLLFDDACQYLIDFYSEEYLEENYYNIPVFNVEFDNTNNLSYQANSLENNKDDNILSFNFEISLNKIYKKLFTVYSSSTYFNKNVFTEPEIIEYINLLNKSKLYNWTYNLALAEYLHDYYGINKTVLFNNQTNIDWTFIYVLLTKSMENLLANLLEYFSYKSQIFNFSVRDRTIKKKSFSNPKWREGLTINNLIDIYESYFESIFNPDDSIGLFKKNIRSLVQNDRNRYLHHNKLDSFNMLTNKYFDNIYRLIYEIINLVGINEKKQK